MVRLETAALEDVLRLVLEELSVFGVPLEDEADGRIVFVIDGVSDDVLSDVEGIPVDFVGAVTAKVRKKISSFLFSSDLWVSALENIIHNNAPENFANAVSKKINTKQKVKIELLFFFF